MYSFEPRLPVNHVMQLVKNLRSGDFDRGDNLLLVGAISGEIGALLKTGFVIRPGVEIIGRPGEELQGFSPNVPNSLGAEDELPSTISGCIHALDAITTEDPQATAIDPSLLIPIVLKLIELWLARRGG